MSEPHYEVVWPLGKSTTELVEMQPRIADLSNTTVAALFHVGFRDGEVLATLQEELTQLYPGIQILTRDVLGDIHGRNEAQVLAELPDKFREYRVRAAICGVGA
jgi:hypothetical protein